MVLMGGGGVWWGGGGVVLTPSTSRIQKLPESGRFTQTRAANLCVSCTDNRKIQDGVIQQRRQEVTSEESPR